MMATLHAIIGAALGSLFRDTPVPEPPDALKFRDKGVPKQRNIAAFASGVVSHVTADALPHKDTHVAVDIALFAGVMAALIKWKGVNSPEVWGAIGGVIPDLEHGLLMTGLIRPEQEIFPTHIDGGKYHGLETNERWSQLIIAAGLIAGMVWKDRSGAVDAQELAQ